MVCTYNWPKVYKTSVQMKYNLIVVKSKKNWYYVIDSYEGSRIDNNGKKKQKRKRRSLGMTIYPKPKTPIEKEHNKKMKMFAEEMVAKMNFDYITRNHSLSNNERRTELFIDYFDNYIKHKGTSPSDLSVYYTLRGHLISFRGDQQRIQDIDYAYCRDFIGYLTNLKSRYNQPLSSSSINSYFKKYRLVWKEIVKESIVGKNPTDDIKIPKPIHKERVYLTKDEIKLLVDTPLVQENLKKFFLLSCFTGLRHSDIKRLTWANYIEENDTKYLSFIVAKTKTPLKIPLKKDAVKLIGEPQGEDDKIITGLVYSGFNNALLEKWGYLAGIKKKITPHIARHTFATQFLSQTKDIKSLQYILGHKDIKLTQHYAKLIDEDVKDSLDKMENML